MGLPKSNSNSARMGESEVSKQFLPEAFCCLCVLRFLCAASRMCDEPSVEYTCGE